MKRNYVLDFWRFIFALSILMVHSNGLGPADYYRHPFVGGYIAVEFFYIVTGFLMRQSTTDRSPGCLWQPGLLSVKLTVGKLKKLWKITTISTLAMFFLSLAILHPPLKDGLRQGSMLIFEIFYLPMSGFQEAFFNVPLWYLSTICILSPLLYYLLLTKDDLYSNILAPLLSLFIYGWYWTTYHSIENWNIWNGYFLIGILRALAGLNMGITAYGICNWLKNLHLSKKCTVLLAVIENGSYLLVLILSYRWGYNFLDFIKIILLATAVSITFSGRSCLYRHENSPVFYKWGQFGFILYSTHWLSRMAVPWLMPDSSYYRRLPVYIVSALGTAFAVYLITRGSRGNRKGNRKRIE